MHMHTHIKPGKRICKHITEKFKPQTLCLEKNLYSLRFAKTLLRIKARILGFLSVLTTVLALSHIGLSNVDKQGNYS